MKFLVDAQIPERLPRMRQNLATSMRKLLHLMSARFILKIVLQEAPTNIVLSVNERDI